jgi:tryptophan-rich sensory protein
VPRLRHRHQREYDLLLNVHIILTEHAVYCRSSFKRGRGMSRRSVIGFVLFLLASFAAGAVGSAAKPDAWYVALIKPPGTPPNWVFPVVWTTLYGLMAVAAWRVWRRAGFDSALAWWCAQLALNAAWSPVFFGLHQPRWALMVIVAMLCAIATTLLMFARRDRAAAWMFAPYLAWVCYATYLNAGIACLNP